MANQHGDFIWYELMTTDADAAQAFYGGLLGWRFEASDQPGNDYRVCSMGAAPVGGLLQLTKEMTEGGAQPMWAGYVGVDDVDASATKIVDAGGSILLEPWDIDGIGRIAFAADPQGAPFYMMRGQDEDRVSESFSTHEPRDGHCAWNELLTADPRAALAFYGDVFGWVQTDTMDMGPMGEYGMLRNGKDRDFMFGGIMKKPDEIPVSMWSCYFRVPDIKMAAQYVTAHGGQVISGPMEIPGDEFALSGLDPQGATFSIVGK